MFKKAIILVLIMALGGAAFAQTGLRSVSPKDAGSMGMGGAFEVFSTGYDTFFGNPAGFATEKGELTIADLNAWAYFKPTQENIEKAQSIIDGTAEDSDMISYVGDWVVSNGLGAGASLGLGWAGKGFGLGLTLVTDEVAAGNSLLGAKLVSQTQANITAGLAFPFHLGPVTFRVGADARAFYKLNSDPTDGWPFSDIVNAIVVDDKEPMKAIEELWVLGGYGFAFDAGATVGFGPLTVGAMVRDFGLEFNMGKDQVKNLIADKTLPLDGTDPYILAPVISAGAGLRFKLGFIAPSLYVEADNPLAVFEDGFDSAWNNLHAGAEIKLLNSIALRAGLNKGYVSLGAGIDLFIFEVDAALFTEEMGANPGDFGRTGIAIQAAFRL